MKSDKPEDLVHYFNSCSNFEEALKILRKKTNKNPFSQMLEALAIHFEKVASKNELKKIYRRIGDIYNQMSEFDIASKWYEKAKYLDQ